MKQETLDRIKELTAQDNKTLSQRALKLCEEAGEVAAATLSTVNAPGCEYKILDADDVSEELADTIIVAYSLAMDLNCSPDTLENIIIQKLDKWQRVLQQ